MKEMIWTALFFVVGLLETVLAYVIFSRADDHPYYLQIANNGIQAVTDHAQELLAFKSNAAAVSFYILTAPGRWLGGHELIHLLWLRLLILFGFLVAFNWFQKTVSPELSEDDRNAKRHMFMLLVLLYPGQLGWTASLLRDGVATSMFFLGLACSRPNWRIIPAAAFLLLSFSMRPEYLLILVLLVFALLTNRLFAAIKFRIAVLLLLLLFFSIATHSIQVLNAEFAQFAYSEANAAYPLVTSAFDLHGYFLILCQAIIDPASLGKLGQATLFSIAETIFFLYLLWQSRLLLRHSRTKIAALAAALIFGLWLFAYYETFVSGFSRHRLSLEIALIALLSVAPPERERSAFKLSLFNTNGNIQWKPTPLLAPGKTDERGLDDTSQIQ
jgi:hypothetical protein